MVKFMEGEITFGLCLEFSEVVKKKWTALQTLMWRGLQNTSCDLKKNKMEHVSVYEMLRVRTE